jgi:predicted DNA-binding ribbon-helix-helix protein
MCHLFAGIPLEKYESETRSVRLSGHATSIRLEVAFWQILEDLAADQGLTLPKFLTTLHDEVLDLHGEARNFTSLLRCTCLIHLERSVRTREAEERPWPLASRAPSRTAAPETRPLVPARVLLGGHSR